MGLIEALMGQTDFRAQAPAISTKPGQAAIAQQLSQAGQQAAASGYALAAGSRGPGTALALREAQRRSSQAIMGAGNQAAIQAHQLEQEAMMARANAQMQAQQINAGIEQQNAQGLGRLAGAAVMGGALAMSDEQSKVVGPPSQDMGGHYLSDARAKQLEGENASLKAHIATMGHALRVGGGAVTPLVPAAMDIAQTAGPMPQMQHLATPDIAKSRVHDEASAAAYGEQVMAQRRMAMLEDLQRQKAAQAQNEIAQARLAQEQQQASLGQAGMDLARQQNEQLVASDERSKSAGHMSHLQFPSGVEPVAFHYKPGMGDGPDQHYGVLAQDLEKSKEGATTVEQDPQSGMKMVDTNRLTMLNTAKLAEFEHRLRKLGA